uniref:glutathione gamma-glutamylcysteinyltransferase n=1 Tax=Trebouxia lynnae TaxID=1825957 RepID=A0A6F8J132_9CHLO|nr:similar to phytochelatin synthase [Trebouxia lynnae]
MALPAADFVSFAGTSKTFYKRALPCPPALSFSSSEGKRLFAEALQAGTMQSFFKLIEQFRTQDEPAFCGLASLAMVLNALAIDPRRAWKGPWRWFHEQMLDCCEPLSQVLASGINLDQAACLARCNGAKAHLSRYGRFTEESFRSTVQEMCASEQQHMIVSYSRKHLLQTGDGHFSPVGGYHAEQDMVLILDTARFKYPPHWVPLRQLYQAMAHSDPATGKARGFITLRPNPRLKSVMFTLNRPTRAWQDMKAFMETTVPAILKLSAHNNSPARRMHWRSLQLKLRAMACKPMLLGCTARTNQQYPTSWHALQMAPPMPCQTGSTRQSLLQSRRYFL